MQPSLTWTQLALLLLLLVLLASGCAQNSPLPDAVVEPARVLPLPQEARQPTPPAICSSGCSNGLTKLRTELLDMLTKAASPASPASAPTSR